MNEKKVYEEPEVTMVEFDFSDRIADSGCLNPIYSDYSDISCYT